MELKEKHVLKEPYCIRQYCSGEGECIQFQSCHINAQCDKFVFSAQPDVDMAMRGDRFSVWTGAENVERRNFAQNLTDPKEDGLAITDLVSCS